MSIYNISESYDNFMPGLSITSNGLTYNHSHPERPPILNGEVKKEITSCALHIFDSYKYLSEGMCKAMGEIANKDLNLAVGNTHLSTPPLFTSEPTNSALPTKYISEEAIEIPSTTSATHFYNMPKSQTFYTPACEIYRRQLSALREQGKQQAGTPQLQYPLAQHSARPFSSSPADLRRSYPTNTLQSPYPTSSTSTTDTPYPMPPSSSRHLPPSEDKYRESSIPNIVRTPYLTSQSTSKETSQEFQTTSTTHTLSPMPSDQLITTSLAAPIISFSEAQKKQSIPHAPQFTSLQQPLSETHEILSMRPIKRLRTEESSVVTKEKTVIKISDDDNSTENIESTSSKHPSAIHASKPPLISKSRQSSLLEQRANSQSASPNNYYSRLIEEDEEVE